jgi:hypothetical protein
MNRSICGGIIQEAGIKTSLQQLTVVVAPAALMYCRYFEFDGRLHEVLKCAELIKEAPPAGRAP